MYSFVLAYQKCLPEEKQYKGATTLVTVPGTLHCFAGK